MFPVRSRAPSSTSINLHSLPLMAPCTVVSLSVSPRWGESSYGFLKEPLEIGHCLSKGSYLGLKLRGKGLMNSKDWGLRSSRRGLRSHLRSVAHAFGFLFLSVRMLFLEVGGGPALAAPPVACSWEPGGIVMVTN